MGYTNLYLVTPTVSLGFLGGSDGKESACNARDLGSIPGSERSPGEGDWQPIPVFLPGESHGQRSLPGSSPWGPESWTWLSYHNFCYLINIKTFTWVKLKQLFLEPQYQGVSVCYTLLPKHTHSPSLQAQVYTFNVKIFVTGLRRKVKFFLGNNLIAWFLWQMHPLLTTTQNQLCVYRHLELIFIIYRYSCIRHFRIKLHAPQPKNWCVHSGRKHMQSK